MRRLTYLAPAMLALVLAAALGGAGRAAETAIPAGGSITIPDCCTGPTAPETGTPGLGTPYPSTIPVASGDVSNNLVDTVKVTVTLDGQWPDDVGLLLVGPTGVKVLLMSNVGGNAGNGVTPDTLTFDDAAIAPVSDIAQLIDGTYKPSSSTPDCDNQTEASAFPSPAPQPPYLSTLFSFHNTGTVGQWKLYAIDDCNLAAGASISSWTLQISPLTPTGVTVKSFAGTRSTPGVLLRWRTANEAEALGFNVYRVVNGKQAKVNKQLIRAKRSGKPAGAAYVVRDSSARKAGSYRYRLQVVTLAGTRTWVAAAVVAARR